MSHYDKSTGAHANLDFVIKLVEQSCGTASCDI